jgi:eukaryotic-like serine/threonine-protein kinase
VLAERYRLIRQLARGGMGSVWRAEHLTLRSEVAVKIIDPTIASHELGLPRFLREARALAALHSPYIVQVIDFGTIEDVAYLVMELLEGQTLGQRLKTEGKLSAAETHRILGDVCKAMAHAHDRGIVHRDLKPDNIFLCDESREHVTKVLDFGIAKPTAVDMASNVDTGDGAFLGTPSYMSPEQCRGMKIDQRTDLWALGAIAYECLLGKRLFAGDAVGDVIVRVCSGELPFDPSSTRLPPGFAAWLQKAMARDPAERFQTAPQLFSALSAVLDGAPRPSLGLDSAETLSDGTAPASTQVLEPGGASSTLASGSLEKTARRTGERKRAPSRLMAGGAIALLSITAAALIRSRTSPPAVTGETRAEEREIRSRAPSRPESSVASPDAGAAVLPAGAAPRTGAPVPGAETPAKERAPREEAPAAAGATQTKATPKAPARRSPLHEMEQLRKKR